jgi:hypothetical protein
MLLSCACTSDCPTTFTRKGPPRQSARYRPCAFDRPNGWNCHFLSGLTSSTWLTPSACASSYRVTTVGLRRPYSTPLMYCWLKPETSASRSCVIFFLRRRRARFRPTSLRMSMRQGQRNTYLEFINFSIRQARSNSCPRFSNQRLRCLVEGSCFSSRSAYAASPWDQRERQDHL